MQTITTGSEGKLVDWTGMFKHSASKAYWILLSFNFKDIRRFITCTEHLQSYLAAAGVSSCLVQGSWRAGRCSRRSPAEGPGSGEDPGSLPPLRSLEMIGLPCGNEHPAALALVAEHSLCIREYRPVRSVRC